jgi:thiamine transport system substrate-binding protein
MTSTSHRPLRYRIAVLALAASITAISACGSSDSTERVTLVAYDSFPVGDTTLNEALAAFTEESGIEVEIVSAGDTGTMVSKAVLTAGNPEGDVIWGVDNTFLSRAIDIFEPYTPTDASRIDPELRALVPGGEAVPVTFGDVCVNIDLDWFAERNRELPTSLDDLIDPEFANLLVVQHPATSSPGLAFVMATIAAYGDGWTQYWADLRDNGVAVTDGWTESYYERFTWAGGGDRPLVVSYGSSPPAEVIFADPVVTEAPTAVIEDTCFRQVEFAGMLAGTKRPDAARALLDFLISEQFQREIALNLFVYPTIDVTLPPEFVAHAVVPTTPLTLDPETIDTGRSSWIDIWTSIVVR